MRGLSRSSKDKYNDGKNENYNSLSVLAHSEYTLEKIEQE